MICYRQKTGGERSHSDETAVAEGVQGDRIVPGVDAGEQRAPIGIGDPGDIARGEAGVDDDGRFEGAGLPGIPWR